MAGPSPLNQPTFPGDFVDQYTEVLSVDARSHVPNTKGHDWLSYSTNPPHYPTSLLGASWSCIPTPSASGGAAGRAAISSWLNNKAAGASPFFSPRAIKQLST